MPNDNKKGGNMGKDGANMGGGAVDVQKYLSGVDYPATKQDLLDSAGDNDAPQEVIDALNGIAEKEYASPAEVSKEVGMNK